MQFKIINPRSQKDLSSGQTSCEEWLCHTCSTAMCQTQMFWHLHRLVVLSASSIVEQHTVHACFHHSLTSRPCLECTGAYPPVPTSPNVCLAVCKIRFPSFFFSVFRSVFFFPLFFPLSSFFGADWRKKTEELFASSCDSIWAVIIYSDQTECNHFSQK